MSTKGALALTAVVVLAAGAVAAEERSWNLEDVTAIVEPQTEVGRVLFRVDLPAPERPVAVRRARVRVPVGELEVSRSMILRIHPVTTSWDRGAVTWTSGWSRPGGDFDDWVRGSAELVSGRGGDLVFDATILAKRILEDGMENEGFILTIDPGQGLGLPGVDLSRIGALSGATLEVEYRKVPPLPPGVG